MNKIFRKLAIFFANKSGGVVLFGNKGLLLQLKHPLDIKRVNTEITLAEEKMTVEILTEYRHTNLKR